MQKAAGALEVVTCGISDISQPTYGQPIDRSLEKMNSYTDNGFEYLDVEVVLSAVVVELE